MNIRRRSMNCHMKYKKREKSKSLTWVLCSSSKFFFCFECFHKLILKEEADIGKKKTWVLYSSSGDFFHMFSHTVIDII